MNNCTPSRIYKIIPQDQFESGDEIRVSKIASDRMLAPTFYSASLVTQGSKNYVVIEMDDAGLSLGKWMDKLAEEDPEEEVKEPEQELSAEEKAMREMLEKLRAQYDTYTVIDIKESKRVSMQEAIEKLYPSQEVFYFTLFSKIKAFAENNISYRDTHVGNIMPNHGQENGMQLIDFDGAQIHGSVEEAAKKSMASAYTSLLFQKFSERPNLSKESKELIEWFASKALLET